MRLQCNSLVPHFSTAHQIQMDCSFTIQSLNSYIKKEMTLEKGIIMRLSIQEVHILLTHLVPQSLH